METLNNDTNYGILASISWNSNKWKKTPTDEDLKKSKYDYVIGNSHMHESLNFGNDIYPPEEDGYYIGYTPMFNTPPRPENSKYVSVVFLMSSNYRDANKKCIVGLYGFPAFGEIYTRQAKHPLFDIYNDGNIASFSKDIIYFDNYVEISNKRAEQLNLLPKGKKISQQGFNYLQLVNVQNILELAFRQNLKNKKLKNFINRLPFQINLVNEEVGFNDYMEIVGDNSADTLAEILQLEKKMKNKAPEIKQRISSYIERGAIANKFKKVAKYKCQVCESLKETTLSFKKANGFPYIETHHIEFVSTMNKGVLCINNLLSVCAHHHRQLHYGNVKIIDNNNTHISYSIDDSIIKIPKIPLLQI